MIDVAIIGCNPVGARAANLLGRSGPSATGVDKDRTHDPLPRAVHPDQKMMRLARPASVIDRVMADTDGHLHLGGAAQVVRCGKTVGLARPFGLAGRRFLRPARAESASARRLRQHNTMAMHPYTADRRLADAIAAFVKDVP